ncbi:SulP family inorganic anion transporter [Streptomyces sp. SID8352]|uniref:SulP family inorganic anion transporter n=1 Tax=Streptomyces sp. SID8352 TaxID=2690338 RepID=UPI001F019E25|nr:SulP family inorganic anion transporter [Streptomyces sp. SID8352]
MPACVPSRAESARIAYSHPPHSPPRGRFPRPRIAGADVSASISVFLIALPLSLGIALATGAPLQAGLVAAAVGGIVAGWVGGCPLQVSGPAAGLTVVTADLIQRYGWRTTCAITVLAGLSQLALGCLRVARTALAVSPAVVHGMLAGIGITIAVAQLHIVLGGTPHSSVPDNLRALPAQLAALRPADLAVSVLTLTLLASWPKIPGRFGRAAGRLPAALVAVVGATAVVALLGLRVPEVDLPSWSSHALATLPEGPVLGLAAAVLTTTLVCSVQSLLGAVAVDKLVAARPGPPPGIRRSRLDRELLGQGAANIVSGTLGGLPIAGVAVRSSANVRAGAVSRNSTMLHGALVVVAALLLVPVLELIPLPSLAALVMAVGARMVSLHHIRTVTRHREAPVYAATTGGVVFLGVLEGVALGIAVAVGVALHQLARTRITHEETDGVHRVRVRGQLTFLAVPRLSRVLHQVPQGSDAVVELDGSFMDHAAYETLQDWQRTHTAQGGGSIRLTGSRPSSGGPLSTGFPDTGPSGTGTLHGGPLSSDSSGAEPAGTGPSAGPGRGAHTASGARPTGEPPDGPRGGARGRPRPGAHLGPDTAEAAPGGGDARGAFAVPADGVVTAGLRTPAAADVNGVPGPPDLPGDLRVPRALGSPGDPGALGDPGTPGEPGALGDSGALGEPGAAVVPGAPGDLGSPGGPRALGDPYGAGTPGAAGTAGITGAPEDARLFGWRGPTHRLRRLAGRRRDRSRDGATPAPSSADLAALTVELQRVRRVVEAGFSRTDGALIPLTGRYDRADRALDDHAARLDALERHRRPLLFLAALTGIVALAVSVWQVLAH